jgi:diadenylate cyclase
MRESKKDDVTEIIKIISPGTSIRAGLDNILKAKTGGLIVIGDSKEVLEIVDGGFYINVEYTPARLYELAKMDGAIIISSDLKRILYANAQLIPDSLIETRETGTRHRTAERTAKQTKQLVISISQRRSVITIYKGNYKYVIEDTSKVLERANQALQTAEKYRKVYDKEIDFLNEYEFNDIVTLENVITVIQRAELVMKMVDEVKRQIYELGEEGRLIEIQLEEIIGDLEKEEMLIIKDYISENKDVDKVLEEIIALDVQSILNPVTIAKILGYENFEKFDEIGVYTKGYRILNKVPKMPSNIVENLIKSFKSFQHILVADIPELDEVEGIGEIRARTIKQALQRMQEQFVFDKLLS